MIIEEIINEIDKFITKYKTLKSDNQSLTQFKSDVKTALNVKGIISTNEDSEVIPSITNYAPPSTGGTTLDVDYLKKVGLLPYYFSGTPTERDLKVNRFLFQDPNNERKFISSDYLNDITVKFNEEVTNDFRLARSNTTSDNQSIDKNKYTISNEGYYINEFKFTKPGTYKVSVGTSNFSLDKIINYTQEVITSMEDYLVYAVNIKSKRFVCYDTNKTETINYFDDTTLDSTSAVNYNNVVNNLNSLGTNLEKFGYVYNLRTGKAHLLDIKWDTDISMNSIPKKFKYGLSTLVNSNKIIIVLRSYLFSLSVSGSTPETFISDIDYQDGDTLVLTLFNRRNASESQDYPTTSVEEYLKTISSELSSEEPPVGDLSDVTISNYTDKMNSLVDTKDLHALESDYSEYVTALYGQIYEYDNGVVFSFSRLEYKDNDPGYYKHVLAGLSSKYIKGFKSIIVFDFNNIFALDPQAIINKSINLNDICRGAGYVAFNLKKDHVYYKEGSTVLVGKSDTFSITGDFVDGKPVKVAVNGDGFKPVGGSLLDYHFSSDTLDDHL